ncbi:hypothetical protein GPECTOR_8g409 [Gonium pectorale]|uniref:ABC transmembrane type-1 domain-containing protein n=1 Tax=Gonium pectorale TaxID=33097 RepID=A0A150GTE1_GONPE|nr:hypothetical protein GPECTOR_8g409 [Gonium pectorale]|eukprot:KXZ53044.1 hypothetical protein GPECTOR_8g409 [Gonium pectorale]
MQALRLSSTSTVPAAAAPPAAGEDAASGGGAGLSPGYISTLIGADVRRFDDCMPYWPYLLASPPQLLAVLVMVGLELDFVSSVAGVATSLAIIPLQGLLTTHISDLRTARARCTDERVRVMAEAVEGMMTVKMCGLEGMFERRLLGLRAREERYVRWASRIRALNLALFTSVSAIVSFVTFSVHRARHGSLDVASVFYTLSLLQLPAGYLVHNFTTGRSFQLPRSFAAVSYRSQATQQSQQQQRPALRGVRFVAAPAGSVRDNILFGLPYDEAWYGNVVRSCCLEDDIRGLPGGDTMELGEGGAGLSGGQKARVALARAVYCRPDVALLDDPLSAVDPRVGQELFERVLGPCGLLAACGTTRLLVTHQTQHLPRYDRKHV